MYGHLSQGPDAATITLADFLTDKFMEFVPIDTSQVETSVEAVAVLPPTQDVFPDVVVNGSPQVSLVWLIAATPLLTAGWYSKSIRTRF